MNKFFWRLDYIGAHIPKFPRLKDTIVITGTPRSGSTWLLEILRSLRGYKSIVEPLHQQWYPQIKSFNLPPRPYLPIDQGHDILERYIRKVLLGKVAGYSPLYQDNFRTYMKKIFARKIIVKFVRANRILPWILKRFSIRQSFLIIRHPLSTIASQLKTGYRGYFYPSNVPVPKEVFIQDFAQHDFLRNDKDLWRKIKQYDTQEELLAVTWCLDNYLLKSTPKPFPWKLIVYEKLVLEGEKVLKEIFGSLGEKVPENAINQLRIPSMTTKEKDNFNAEKRLSKWKKELSSEQINRILSVLSLFEMEYYSEEIEPDYSKLFNLV